MMTTTYSMWRLFRDCRRRCRYRYFDHLVPKKKATALRFGSLIHECLELWHTHGDLELVLDHIDRACLERAGDEQLTSMWHLARAMMTGYVRRYPREDFEVVAIEETFEGAIVNPETCAASRSFKLAGKVDGIVRKDGSYFLLEHKTASHIDGSYIERLWTDFQIILYAWYVEQSLGFKIAGIIYNVLAKAKLQQNKGETEGEFQARRAQLIAKSKTGKTSAKRRMPESDEEFQARLAEKYADPEMFLRQVLYISRDRFAALQDELWELGQQLLDARRRDVWYQNTSQCFQYGRPCPYYPLCSSGDSPIARENLYDIVEPHEELRAAPLAF